MEGIAVVYSARLLRISFWTGSGVWGNSPLRLEAGADELIQLVTFGPIRSNYDDAVGTLCVTRSDGGKAMAGIPRQITGSPGGG